MNEILKIITYFYIYSFIGWVLESIYKTIYEKKIVNSGFLYGPFCPIYGFGALIMYYILSGYNNNPVHVFIIGFVVLSVWEYIVAWALEKLLHTKYWDYSNNKFNLNGRVCLLNSFFWGVLGLVFIYIVHPFIQNQIANINHLTLIIISLIISLGLIIDIILSTKKINDIKKKIEDIKKIGEEIKLRLAELKTLKNSKLERKEAIQVLVNDLKTQEANIKEKLIKQTKRIRKAFPTMQSEIIKQISKYIRK